MCGGGPDLPPPQPSAKDERLQAEADATASANGKAAAARRAKQKQSLLASGAQGNTDAAPVSTVLAAGKDKLGS